MQYRHRASCTSAYYSTNPAEPACFSLPLFVQAGFPGGGRNREFWVERGNACKGVTRSTASAPWRTESTEYGA